MPKHASSELHPCTSMANSLPLNECHVKKFKLYSNRLHFFTHGVALLFLFYYRLTSITQIIKSQDPSTPPLLPHVLILIAEAILAFLWLINQPSKWRPVVRTPHPERLPGDGSLPAIDVFVCTADPNKEPSLNVMNTVVSAMALDYPPEKLHVYISDDGGSSVTLRAAERAWEFSKYWIPFCRKYEIKNRCPEAYFLEEKGNGPGKVDGEFMLEETEIQRRYEEFKSRVAETVGEMGVSVSRDHAAVFKVISDANGKDSNKEDERMPFLAYVAREKRPSHPHHFKAGALNVLLRVSGMITNSPYILGLDCDMYCNDPSSARQAMCFHLDSKLSPKLGFVQFPQKFYNLRHDDIYDGQLRFVWEKWEGFDGINMGPVLSGTCYYIKREALYGTHKFQEDGVNLDKLKSCYGSSNDFIKSMYRKYKPNHPKDVTILDNSLSKELQLLASCSYDKGTKWGDDASYLVLSLFIVVVRQETCKLSITDKFWLFLQVGFRYFAVVEDYFTSFHLHCEGWTSVYVNPLRPCFLGASPISLNDQMVQRTRWFFGLTQVGLSRFSPLLYGHLRMSLWRRMCYAEFTHIAISFLPLYVLAIVPQVCLLRGIPLYPTVSSPYFVVFTFIFLSSQIKHVQEVLSTGYSIRNWLSEQRTWIWYSLVPYLYASIDTVMEKIGVKAASFLPTNKVVDDEQEKRYRLSMYDFQASAVFMVPLCSLYMLNVASFVFGFGSILEGNEMVMQGFIPFFGMVLNFPLFEGMVLRKDKGRVSPFVCVTSAVVCSAVLCLVSLVNYH